MAFLEATALREESVPDGRGEVVFYNLGKFSQVISDFESIHFHSQPVEKYASFANFLQYQADEAYPEGWQDNAYATPDAVQIMTVHQAKGLQWPAVFVPQLVRNRFPGVGSRGRTPWHLLPAAAFENAQRYKGGLDDERRLFYVAVTRAQRFLHLTWAPTPGNSHAQAASVFFTEAQASKYVKRRRQTYEERKRLEPSPKASVANVVLSFSDMKYFFECPYQFKLRILYGFNAPLADKPASIVVDFFSGSGTTAHAVMRLNRQDGGRRQCISITNNEVAAEEQRRLREQDLRPGDPEWERWGICEYITKPRIAAAISGRTPEGEPIKGEYRFTDEFPMEEGFAENAEFFTLTYETPVAVAHNLAFERIAPLLWMRAGAEGTRIDALPEKGWEVTETYGLLVELDQAEAFAEAVDRQHTVRIAYVVTDDERRFQAIVRTLPASVEPVRLYESYLTNFRFSMGR
jgi:hypothetical protein